MSHALTRWAWTLDLTPTNKLVLLALADTCNGERDLASCWPSTVHLARATGLGRRSIQRALRDLEQLCLVKVITGSGKTSSTYTLACTDTKTLPLDLNKPDVRGATVTPLRSVRGATLAPQGRHSGASDEVQGRHSGASDDVQGRHSVAEGRHSGARTRNEIEEKTCSQRERRVSCEGGGVVRRSLQDPLALPDWHELARAIRPDIDDPSESWSKFQDFYLGGEDSNARPTPEWENLWKRWISREYKKRSSRYNPPSDRNRKPGSFIEDLNTDSIPASYERVKG